MTDWLPWGFVFMTGTFVTLALSLRAFSRPGPVDWRPVWWSLGITAALSFLLFALYVILGESWVWYLK